MYLRHISVQSSVPVGQITIKLYNLHKKFKHMNFRDQNYLKQACEPPQDSNIVSS